MFRKKIGGLRYSAPAPVACLSLDGLTAGAWLCFKQVASRQTSPPGSTHVGHGRT